MNADKTIKNLTPHSVIIDGIEFKPEGIIPRVSQEVVQVGTCNGIPIVRVEFGDVVDIPEERPDTLLIVSAMVRSALPNRKDLASPGYLVRDANGVVIDCKNLIVN